jgi:hypothetical protein
MLVGLNLVNLCFDRIGITCLFTTIRILSAVSLTLLFIFTQILILNSLQINQCPLNQTTTTLIDLEGCYCHKTT